MAARLKRMLAERGMTAANTTVQKKGKKGKE